MLFLLHKIPYFWLLKKSKYLFMVQITVHFKQGLFHLPFQNMLSILCILRNDYNLFQENRYSLSGKIAQKLSLLVYTLGFYNLYHLISTASSSFHLFILYLFIYCMIKYLGWFILFSTLSSLLRDKQKADSIWTEIWK